MLRSVINPCPGVEVIDNFLPLSEYRAAHHAAKCEPLFAPDDYDTEAIWSTNEAHNPKVSRIILKALTECDRQVLIAAGLGDSTFPTGSKLDSVIRSVEGHLLGHSSFGIAQRDWAGLIASVFAFGQGCGLPWHRDAVDYAGAFVLYLHNAWSSSCGGELLVKSEEATEVTISPTPNRLVLLEPGVRHAVRAVVDTDAPRLSISGFVIRTDRVEHLLAKVMRGSQMRKHLH